VSPELLGEAAPVEANAVESWAVDVAICHFSLRMGYSPRQLAWAPLAECAMPLASSILAGSDDSELVFALRQGHPSAKIELVDRYVRHVERILARILGRPAELEDLVHEVFARSLQSIVALKDPSALRPWLTGIAVVTAREYIRGRIRGRWLRFFATEEVPEIEVDGPDHESREALRVTYAVLDRLGTDERVAFALRHIECLELADVASASGTSLNTIKRRLARAERRFLALAEHEPALKPWLQGGVGWRRG
jgi:RNA polymerase sigma-70 factor (ECF subfamily)